QLDAGVVEVGRALQPFDTVSEARQQEKEGAGPGFGAPIGRTFVGVDAGREGAAKDRTRARRERRDRNEGREPPPAARRRRASQAGNDARHRPSSSKSRRTSPPSSASRPYQTASKRLVHAEKPSGRSSAAASSRRYSPLVLNGWYAIAPRAARNARLPR